MPNEPLGPIVTTNSCQAGKFWAKMVTLPSTTTFSMVNVGMTSSSWAAARPSTPTNRTSSANGSTIFSLVALRPFIRSTMVRMMS